MSNEQSPKTDPDQLIIYEIRLRGQLDAKWIEWFGGLKISQDENGETVLRGPLADQAALHGILKKIRNLGLPLVSISPIGHGFQSILDSGQVDASNNEAAKTDQ